MTPVVFIAGLFDANPAEQARRWFAPRVALSPELLGYGAFAGASARAASMEAQADHVASLMRGAGIGSSHLVGQSVGGVIAFFLADRHPDLAASVISVEGNFTLSDAFWSGQIAVMEERDVEAMLDGRRADPAAWLRMSGMEPTPERLAIAEHALSVRAGALQAMARGAIRATADDTFVHFVEGLIDRGLRVGLVAGQRSRDGWSVPESIVERAGGVQILPGAGHLMMLEAPEEYFALIARLADSLGGAPKRA
jgi:lipase